MPRSFRNGPLCRLYDKLVPGPNRCFGCGKEAILNDAGLCPTCQRNVLFCPPPRCLPPLDGLSIGVQYTPPIRRAVLNLKFWRRSACAPFLVQFMRIPPDWRADILVPVPMHPLRRLIRRNNHSSLLAQQLAAETGIPFTNALLRKTKYTYPQKRFLPGARRNRLRGSFSAMPQCAGLRIVLIDDVFTTGATVYECAKELKRAGAAAVYACVVASSRH